MARLLDADPCWLRRRPEVRRLPINLPLLRSDLVQHIQRFRHYNTSYPLTSDHPFHLSRHPLLLTLSQWVGSGPTRQLPAQDERHILYHSQLQHLLYVARPPNNLTTYADLPPARLPYAQERRNTTNTTSFRKRNSPIRRMPLQTGLLQLERQQIDPLSPQPTELYALQSRAGPRIRTPDRRPSA